MSTEIIAELGVNHSGDLQKAHRMIDEAHKAGATIVKFQHFYPDRVWISPPPKVATCALSFEALTELVQHVRRLDLGVSIAPFDSVSAGEAAALKPNILKIASGEINHLPLVSLIANLACINDLQVMISNGAHTNAEFAIAISRVRSRIEAIIPTYCVSSYPCLLEDVDLSYIKVLSYAYPELNYTGFSDHTRDTLLPALAVIAGATHIEKHLMLDNCIDYQVSVFPYEFKRMVTQVRQAESYMCFGAKPMKCELKVRAATERTLCDDGIWRRP